MVKEEKTIEELCTNKQNVAAVRDDGWLLVGGGGKKLLLSIW